MGRKLFRAFRVPLVAAATAALGLAQPAIAAQPTELFFSEYVEGTGNNKALEIYNGTGAAVDLGAGGYNVQMYFNGNTSPGLTINLTGAVADGDVYVLAHSSAGPAILAQADQANGAGWFNGDDVVVLRHGTTIIDVIGQIGFDPGTEWGSGPTSTADNTLRRNPSVTAGDPDGTDPFDPAVEWDGYPVNTFDGLGSHTLSPPEVCGDSFTPIYDIQGSGTTAAITGVVTTEGVVVGDYQGPSPALGGFYIQDPDGDNDPSTSDGIFVFTGNNVSVILGDVVRVTGTASDFQDQTQISASSITRCGTGSVAPVDVTLPFPSADFPERYEGMLVRLPQMLYVTEHFQLGRFGQIVMSSGGRLDQPTNVALPGAPALALQASNDLNRIIIDDELNDQNPDPIRFGRGGLPLSASNTLRGGDTTTGIVGVMTYGWAGNAASPNAYRVRPVSALGGGVPDFQPANPRPASAPDVGGTLRVASVDLLNFFNTFGVGNCTNGVGGSPTDCRGAQTPEEFDRQWRKAVATILGTGGDVVGFTDMENDGYDFGSAIQFLADRLNDATAPGTYAFIDADAATGQSNALGTDAIKVGLLYKPASVTPVGQTAVLDTVVFVNGGDSGPRNAPSLAQAFEQNTNGERFVVAVNRLKSKGSPCDAPDAGDGQGNCNAVRTTAAAELASWLAGDPTGVQDADVLLIGDLNAYAQEDPVAAIESAGYADLLAPGAYTYAFDGQWGHLDHALGSASLVSQLAGTEVWHSNADEPSVLDYNTNFKSAGQLVSLYSADEFRSSDHDPVLVGLALCEKIPPALEVSLTPDSLWPPSHKYVRVTATVVATDNFDPAPAVTLVSVTSNEPDNGLGDGDTAGDIVILDDSTFDLRAERSGTGSGRVYTITYKATDSCGNSTTGSATVSVPKSQSKNK